MIAEAGLEPGELLRKLWLDKTLLRELHSDGHVIGLHSHTHPTRLRELEKTQQAYEYETNCKVISDCLGHRPDTMSHPCSSYNFDTLEILKGLGVKMGFRANMAAIETRSCLEFRREDHTNVLRMMSHEGHGIYQ